jgi:HAD superfamily hydrolase (TIGR01509 family)
MITKKNTKEDSFAVIFDLDGLLIRDLAIHYESYKKFFYEQYGVEITKDDFRSILGRKNEELWTHFAQKYGVAIMPGAEAERLVLLGDAILGVTLYDGARELLNELMDAEVPIALATGSSRRFVESILAQLGILACFHAIVTADDVVHGKPDPEPFQKAAEAIGANPQHCVALEDAPLGIMSAKAAGMKAVAIPNEFTARGDFSQADMVVPGLRAVHLALLRDLVN